MKHDFYFYGDSKRIFWGIRNSQGEIVQSRDHADIYLDKVSSFQSKFVALHVGLFWCIGTFNIKNEDEVTINTEEESIFNHLKFGKSIEDKFVKNKMWFINQLIEQRKLKINYKLISHEENMVKP